MQKISGAEIAQKIIDDLKSRPAPKKFFAAILVGENPTSISFLKQKEKTAKELNLDFRTYKFPEKIKNDDLRKEVGKIALLKGVGGVIIQLPLPEHLNRHYILNVIPREKDVDVLGERSLGAFYAGRNPVLPPAVNVVKEILSNAGCQISDIKIAIIGAGFLIGKPIAVWLINQKVKKITVFEKESDLSELKEYDLIISGAGQANLIKPEMLKENVGIIDFGYSLDEHGKISGDFNTQLPIANYRLLRFYTKTPGGAGPILVAKIFENFYKLNDEI